MATDKQRTSWADMVKDIITPIHRNSVCCEAQLAIARVDNRVLDADKPDSIANFFSTCKPGDTVAIAYDSHEEFLAAVSTAAECLETNQNFAQLAAS